MTPPIQYACFVCGLGSVRPFNDWVNKFNTSIGPLVACDGHSRTEIDEGLKRLKATISVGGGPNKTPDSTKNTKPQAPGQPITGTGTDVPKQNDAPKEKEQEQAKSAS